MINVIGISKDYKSNTTVVYAKIKPSEYLKLVGEDFGEFEIQRKRENHKAYGRLKTDILKGAALPPITLSVKPQYVDSAESLLSDFEELSNFLGGSAKFNILDGLQRTYIISDIAKEGGDFHQQQELLLEIWLEGNLDKLIYRIIVLNAGQKPMSTRHQVELLFSSLHTPIQERVGGIELVREKDQRRRRKPGIFPFETIVSGYQSFISASTELNKENLVSQQLQVDSSLDQSEAYISAQFELFIKYLKYYIEIDKEVFRLYPTQEGAPDGVEDKETSAAQHWLTTGNTCMSFFASLSQFSPHDESDLSTKKRQRIEVALEKLISKLQSSHEGDDPLHLEAFEVIRRGKSARKINIGTYTRRLLANGFKEFYREEGDISLGAAWNLAVD